MASVPKFDILFNLLKKVGRLNGFIILKPKSEYTRFEKIISLCNWLATINLIYVLISFPLFIFLTNPNFLEVVSVFPTLWYGSDVLLKILIFPFINDHLLLLMQDFEILYEKKWSNSEIQNKNVNDFNNGHKKLNIYLKGNLFSNATYTISPLIVSYGFYVKTANWNPLFILNCWYPFDKVKHYWITYSMEFFAARTSVYQGVVFDVLLCIFLLLLSYFFESLGNEIHYAINNFTTPKKQLRNSLIELYLIHLKLIR